MATPAGDLTGIESGRLPYQVNVLASAARTADPVSATDLGFGTPGQCNSLLVVINATAKGAAPSVVFNIEGFDPASATWYTILASAAVTTAAPTQVILRVIPGGTVTANLRADDILPPRIRIRPVHGNTDSLTYSVGAVFSNV